MYTNKISPGKLAWKRFKKNPLSLGSLITIVLIFLIAMAGYLITPDKSPHGNTQFLELAGKKPGFVVQMLLVRKNQEMEKPGLFRFLLNGRESAFNHYPINDYFFRGDSIIVFEYTDFPGEEIFQNSFHLADVVYPVESILSKEALSLMTIDQEKLTPETESIKSVIIQEHLVHKNFVLGTDRFGRDMLSRLILGARISVSVGFIAVLISLLIGIFLGALAGYYPGAVDNVIMWFIQVVWSVPTLLLVIALTMVIGKGFWQIFIAVGITMWVEVARIVRGQVMSVRKKEFVDAARVMGLSDLRILFKHILPNIYSPIIIISAANFASAILIEAGLSFLGVGVQPPVPSWGTMIRDHYGFIIVDKAYLAFIPGFAIMILVLSFTLIGNGLRDAYDVKET